MLHAVAAQEPPLGERILVAAVGPLLTVLLGGLVVWLVTFTIQSKKAKDDNALLQAREDKLREQDLARADSDRERELLSRDDRLRHELVTEMTEAAGALYMKTQHYWRAKKDAGSLFHDPETVKQWRTQLDEQYLRSRTSGQVLEYRLQAYFVTRDPEINGIR